MCVRARLAAMQAVEPAEVEEETYAQSPAAAVMYVEEGVPTAAVGGEGAGQEAVLGGDGAYEEGMEGDGAPGDDKKRCVPLLFPP